MHVPQLCSPQHDVDSTTSDSNVRGSFQQRLSTLRACSQVPHPPAETPWMSMTGSQYRNEFERYHSKQLHYHRQRMHSSTDAADTLPRCRESDSIPCSIHSRSVVFCEGCPEIGTEHIHSIGTDTEPNPCCANYT